MVDQCRQRYARPSTNPRLSRAAGAFRSALVVVLGACVLTACSASGSASSPEEPTSSASSFFPLLPDGGVYLADAGIQHGPEGFSVPAGLLVDRTIDQSNVVTLILSEQEGARLETYLRENVIQMGFKLVGDVEGSLLFISPNWEGAYTSNDGVAGLTLRRDPGGFHEPS